MTRIALIACLALSRGGASESAPALRGTQQVRPLATAADLVEMPDVDGSVDHAGPYAEEPAAVTSSNPQQVKQGWTLPATNTSLEAGLCNVHGTGYWCANTSRIRCCKLADASSVVKCGSTVNSVFCGGVSGAHGTWSEAAMPNATNTSLNASWLGYHDDHDWDHHDDHDDHDYDWDHHDDHHWDHHDDHHWDHDDHDHDWYHYDYLALPRQGVTELSSAPALRGSQQVQHVVDVTENTSDKSTTTNATNASLEASWWDDHDWDHDDDHDDYYDNRRRRGGGGGWHIHPGWHTSSYCQSHHVGTFCASHHIVHCCNDHGHFVECNSAYTHSSWWC